MENPNQNPNQISTDVHTDTGGGFALNGSVIGNVALGVLAGGLGLLGIVEGIKYVKEQMSEKKEEAGAK